MSDPIQRNRPLTFHNLPFRTLSVAGTSQKVNTSKRPSRKKIVPIISAILTLMVVGGLALSWIHAQNASALAPTVMYAATDAYLTGGAHVDTKNTGFTGSGYVDNYTRVGASAIFTVNILVDGTYAVIIHYANGSGSPQKMSLHANGVKLIQATFPTTSNWNTWRDQTVNLALRTGVNLVSLTYDAGDTGQINLNSIGVLNGINMAARGATLPYTEYEAENAATNGTVIGPDRTFTTLSSEASGRKAVRLSTKGQYVEFTLTQPSNSIDLRYSIPDTADGQGLTAPLSLYINGKYQRNLTLTSKYGWYYGSYTFTNNPADGLGHHFYDETHALLGIEMPAGTKVRLQVDPVDTAPWYVIDLADFEEVPTPYSAPAGSLSVLAYGADPTGAHDSSQAVDTAIAAAQNQGKTVWFPAGNFTLSHRIYANNITLRGAGPWFTTLHFISTVHDMGITSNSSLPASTNVQLYDFSIQGEVMDRNDQKPDVGMHGHFSNSIFQNIWIEHMKNGMWLTGPSDSLLVAQNRIRDTTADGINFYGGLTNSVVEQTQVRNVGDDGLAMSSSPLVNQGNAFRFDTVQLPILANNIAIYGGANNSITDDVVADTLTLGGGIHVSNRFHVSPLNGTTTVARDTLIRTGVLDLNWKSGVGALWFDARDSEMASPINVSYLDIYDSSYEAIQFVEKQITNVTLSHIMIDTTGTFAIQEQAPGSAQFSYITATHLGAGGQYRCNSGFNIARGAGNTGWDDVHCGNIQHPTIIHAYGSSPIGPDVIVPIVPNGATGSGNVTVVLSPSAVVPPVITGTVPPVITGTVPPASNDNTPPVITGTVPPVPQITTTQVQSPAGVRIKNVSQDTYLYESKGKLLYGTPSSDDLTSRWVLENFNGNTRIKNVATGDYLATQNMVGYIEALHKVYDVWRSDQWMLQSSSTGTIIRSYWHQDDVIQIADQSGMARYGTLPATLATSEWIIDK